MLANIHFRRIAWWSVALLIITATRLPAQEGQAKKDPPPSETPAAALGPVPLNKNETVLLDMAGKRLLLKTHVVLREGSLELLCCLKQTKEHESILSLDAKAYVVHTGLLALKAKTGTPVTNDPEYRPPTGQQIDIFVNWKDETGKQRREPAQSWVRNGTRRFFVEPMEQLPPGVELPKNTELRYDRKLKELSWYGSMSVKQKEQFLALSDDKTFRAAIEKFYDHGIFRQMDAHWVFPGSGMYTDADTGKKYYLAEDGDLICVSNFPSATLDIALKSSAVNDALLFKAWTERIPPKETPVTLELVPVFEK